MTWRGAGASGLVIWIGLVAATRADGDDKATGGPRAEVARLRAEVEILRVEHEADLALFKPLISDIRNLDAQAASQGEMTRALAELKAKFPDAGRADTEVVQALSRAGAGLGFLQQLSNDTPEVTQAKEAAINEATARVGRQALDRLRRDVLARSTELNVKVLELEEAEARYRAADPKTAAARAGDVDPAEYVAAAERLVRSGQADLAARYLKAAVDRRDRLSPDDSARLDALQAPATLVSTPIVTQTSSTSEAVAILEPASGDPDLCRCLDPPSEDEVWARLPESARGHRASARLVIEKIGERIDSCENYPLAGHCRLIHCHYKAEVRVDGAASPEAVFIDKDQLVRCDDPGHALPTRDAAVVVASFPPHPSPPDHPPAATPVPAPAEAQAPTLEHRVVELEAAIGRINDRLRRDRR